MMAVGSGRTGKTAQRIIEVLMPLLTAIAKFADHSHPGLPAGVFRNFAGVDAPDRPQ
jgi:hypothetical protein